MSLLAVLATISGIIASSAYYPQAYRIVKRKSAQDISLPSFMMFGLGIFIWLLYGIELRNLPIIIPNIFALVGCFLVLVLSVYYRKNKF